MKKVELFGDGGRSLIVDLNQGWNMISINVSPSREFYLEGGELGPDIILMTEQLRKDAEHHHIIVMKDGLGRFYAPAWDYNGIPYWNFESGYQMMVDDTLQAVWSGNPIPADADVPLLSGWNMIAYFPTYELEASAPEFYVLSPILDHVLIAKNVFGNFLSPVWNFSNMPPWRETQGYQVRVDQYVTLNYPSLPEGDAAWAAARLSIESFSPRSSCNMSVLIHCITGLAECGGVVSAWNAQGVCVGEGVVGEDGRCGLAVWGDEPSTLEREGLLKGEAFWLGMDGMDRMDVVDILEGEGLVYETDSFIVVEAAVQMVLPTEYYLSEPYPNPFNAAMRMTFGLPVAGWVRLSISDLNGRLVDVLEQGTKAVGVHTVWWDAEGVPSGLYLARLEAGGQAVSRKLAVVK